MRGARRLIQIKQCGPVLNGIAGGSLHPCFRSVDPRRMTVPTFRIFKEFALKSIFKGAAVAALMLSLAACGGKGDDKLGDQAEQAADNRADAMEATADNMTGTDRAAMQADAEATRAAGDAREEAIDDADVNADAMSNGQKAAIVNGQ